MTQCAARNTNGQPCRAQAIKGRELCFVHDPGQGVARAEARKRGGERHRAGHGGDPSKMPAQVRSAGQAMAILDYALAETIPMENSIQRARVLIAFCDAYLKAFEVGEFEARLEQLEKEVLKK